MPEIILIAAVATNSAIGRDNQLLWHLPEDMKFFRETTAGQPVLMGRKTWESLPPRFRPLPGRRNLVISRQVGYEAPGAECFESLEDALGHCADETRVFVIGGSEVYRQAIGKAHTLLLTEVSLEPIGDAFFPAISPGEWKETQRESWKSADGVACAFVTYRRTVSN